MVHKQGPPRSKEPPEWGLGMHQGAVLPAVVCRAGCLLGKAAVQRSGACSAASKRGRARSGFLKAKAGCKLGWQPRVDGSRECCSSGRGPDGASRPSLREKEKGQALQELTTLTV